jgi:DNA mismatch repair protein MutS2
LVENTIKEIKESQKPVGEIKKGYEEAKATLKSQVEIEVKKVVDAVTTETDFAPGDNVIMIDNNSSGSIVMVDKDDKMAVVEFNGFKFRLPYDRIKKAENAKEKKSSTAQYVKFDAESRIDIRGRRAEESMRMIDEFISEALMTNLERITIIHGKGTGALKHAVHEFLKYHPSIKSFKLGELVEGGAGVTIAEL